MSTTHLTPDDAWFARLTADRWKLDMSTRPSEAELMQLLNDTPSRGVDILLNPEAQHNPARRHGQVTRLFQNLSRACEHHNA